MTLLAQAAHVKGPDYLMLAGYFILMIGIGLYFYRHMKGMKIYFSGGNSIPWWLAGVSFYMTSFSAFAFVSYTGLCFKYGWVGITVFWVTVPGTICSVLFFAERWRRARIDSPVEYLENRYSHSLRQLIAWFGVPLRLIDDSFKMVATGTFLYVGMDIAWPTFSWIGQAPFVQVQMTKGLEPSILWSGIIMLAYTFMGGLWAVTVTDFIQFVVLGAAVLIVFPLTMDHVGGFAAFVEKSPKGFFDMTADKFDWFYITALVLLYCVAYSSTNWSLIQKYFCVPNGREAKKAGWLVVFLNLVGIPLMLMPAMAAAQFIPAGTADGEVYPRLCAVLLPAGMLGLVIAAMFSATMSTLSSDFNVCAGVLTNDVYRRLLHKNASQRELVTVGRLMTLVTGAICLGIAIYVARGTGGSGEKLFRNMAALFGIAAAPLGLPMMAGLVSRRITNLGALAGLIAGIAVGLGLHAYLPDQTTLLGLVWQRESVMFLGTASTTLAAMIVLSWLFPMTAADRAHSDEFHRRLSTPIGELPQDHRPAVAGEKPISPFGIVGTCTALIGLMMLAIQPWMAAGMATKLNLGMGTALLVLGGITAWASRRSRRGSGDVDVLAGTGPEPKEMVAASREDSDR